MEPPLQGAQDNPSWMSGHWRVQLRVEVRRLDSGELLELLCHVAGLRLLEDGDPLLQQALKQSQPLRFLVRVQKGDRQGAMYICICIHLCVYVLVYVVYVVVRF